MYQYVFKYYAYILKKSKSCNNVSHNYGDTRILIYITFMWVLIALICVPVIKSQFTSWRFCKNLGSAIIPLATSQSTSVYPIIIATHSHTTMTGSGTMSNDLKKTTLHLISVSFLLKYISYWSQTSNGLTSPCKIPYQGRIGTTEQATLLVFEPSLQNYRSVTWLQWCHSHLAPRGQGERFLSPAMLQPMLL